jgi:hypothetical protein
MTQTAGCHPLPGCGRKRHDLTPSAPHTLPKDHFRSTPSSRLPKGEAAGRLWDGLVLVTGADGFFVIDRRYGISGAQPAETIAEVLDQTWADAEPA